MDIGFVVVVVGRHMAVAFAILQYHTLSCMMPEAFRN